MGDRVESLDGPEGVAAGEVVAVEENGMLVVEVDGEDTPADVRPFNS